MFLAEVVTWWGIMQLFAIVSLGICWRIFEHLFDRGYIYSKVAGLILSSFLVWMMASLHLVKYSLGAIYLSLLILLAVSVYAILPELPKFLSFFSENKRLVIAVELLFFFAFLLYTQLGARIAAIAGTEKFPDFAFLNAVLKSDYFPPYDPWFSGEHINYFYFGHLCMANLIKFSSIDSAKGFNLAINLLFAISCLGAFAVAYNLRKKVWVGLLAVIFVAVMGNLDSLYQIMFEKPDGGFNWWTPSRVIVKKELGNNGKLETIDETINEFPFWSFLLRDLHAHVMAIILVFFNLLLMLNLVRSKQAYLGIFGQGKRRYMNIAVMAVSFGAIPIMNMWELPTFYILLAGTIFIAHIKMQDNTDIQKVLLGSLAALAIVLIPANILYLPYHLNFVPQSKSILTVPFKHHTIFGHFIAIYGFFLFIIISYLALEFHYRRSAIPRDERKWIPVILANGGLLMLLLFRSLMITALVLLLMLVVYLALHKNTSKEQLWIYFWLALTLCIVLGPEFIVIKDFYSKHLLRMNTIFKFYFQAWIFLGLICAYLVSEILTKRLKDFSQPGTQVWISCFILLLAISLIFTYMGPKRKLEQHYTEPTLNGLEYLKTWFADDYAAINWFKRNVPDPVVILEATGEAFSHYSRISAATGLPTPLGWQNHESLWRDQSWHSTGQRYNDVTEIYNTTDWKRAQQLMDKYNIRYVYVGNLEKERYKPEGLNKFARHLPAVHSEAGGVIYAR